MSRLEAGESSQPRIEKARLEASAQLGSGKRADLGQFMTPKSTAEFMAGLFNFSSVNFSSVDFPHCSPIRLLDAGAGVGSLTVAFLEAVRKSHPQPLDISVTLYEIDELLASYLSKEMAYYQDIFREDRSRFSINLIRDDFIENAINRIQFGKAEGFNFAILNPPYKKIGRNERHRLLLRQIGLETVNLYSAFVALTVALMAPGGQVAAIIPRSFCNGPYYRPFRDFLLARAAIRHMHLFASRNKAFKDDGVLQENIIILLECGARQDDVTVSTSADDGFADYADHQYSFDQIVFPNDAERFIHVPLSPAQNPMTLSPLLCHSLADIGVEVSTGPIVDFRVRAHLRKMPEAGSVPLLYPGHFTGQSIEWPKPEMKKPNALMRHPETDKWLYPNGFYAIVRRFSSKEEKRRIVARVVSPDLFDDAELLGFENHLNVFHQHKHGLPEELARGLVVFLNSTTIDECFRRFSGHTQVNATDLRMMKHPSRDALIALGRWAKAQGALTQAQIDARLEAML
ncbi:MAG: Eco57I restriction-modification methylase domain-containing protein [Sulfuricellaceae bacterium]